MGKLQREWKGNAIKLQSIFLSPYPIFKGISNNQAADSSSSESPEPSVEVTRNSALFSILFPILVGSDTSDTLLSSLLEKILYIRFLLLLRSMTIPSRSRSDLIRSSWRLVPVWGFWKIREPLIPYPFQHL